MSIINTKQAFEQLNKLNPGQAVINKEYQPNYFEKLFLKSQQKTFYSSVNASTLTTIYTVPQGYTYFVTAIWLSNEREAADATGQTEIYFGTTSAANRIAHIQTERADAVLSRSTSSSISYPIPVKIEQSTIIYLNTVPMARATIIGFLISNDFL